EQARAWTSPPNMPAPMRAILMVEGIGERCLAGGVGRGNSISNRTHPRFVQASPFTLKSRTKGQPTIGLLKSFSAIMLWFGDDRNGVECGGDSGRRHRRPDAANFFVSGPGILLQGFARGVHGFLWAAVDLAERLGVGFAGP